MLLPVLSETLFDLPQPEGRLNNNSGFMQTKLGEMTDTTGVPTDAKANIGIGHGPLDQGAENGDGEEGDERDGLHDDLFAGGPFA